MLPIQAIVTLSKRSNGQYFTTTNPFKTPVFEQWAQRCELYNELVLEPFAGSNNLIEMLGLTRFESFDIEPKNILVKQRDTLASFPSGYRVCITNPPYLAKNSATRRGLAYPQTIYDDLYKHALSLCLQHCDYVAAIVPASLLNAQVFRDRLTAYVLLNQTMFQDTDHPVCLALFEPKANDVEVWDGAQFLGTMKQFEQYLPRPVFMQNLKFNDPNGALGLMAIDNTIGASIRFCLGDEIASDKIKYSSRSVTRIRTDKEVSKQWIQTLNDRFNEFRYQTHDVFLTPFKGVRRDGKMRRRLDFELVRKILS